MATVPLHTEIEPLKDMVPLTEINAEILPELRGSLPGGASGAQRDAVAHRLCG